jgi:hypothetical protein
LNGIVGRQRDNRHINKRDQARRRQQYEQTGKNGVYGLCDPVEPLRFV